MVFQKNRKTSTEVLDLKKKGYKLLKLIGHGGYSKVYFAEFKASGSNKKIQLACKVMDTLKISDKFRIKFLPRELKVITKLSHPYIIQVHSIFWRKEKYFIFMRYAERGDLLEFIKKNGPLSEDQARQWTRQIAIAIQYLHTLEIAHRDLKTENILISAHYNIKLTDFGFATQLTIKNNRLEKSETFCGSLSYCSPEILIGKAYDPKMADMWSLGVVIYTMLNKSNPFKIDSPKVMYENQIKKGYKFRIKYRDQYTKEVKSLVGCLLEPDDQKRYNIQNVLDSDWIQMDPKLKGLNRYEFEALNRAKEEANSKLSNRLSQDTQFNRLFTLNMNELENDGETMTFLKEYDEGFDLQLIRSDYNDNQKRLSE